MELLPLHEFHQALQARFAVVSGCEVVAAYGDSSLEHQPLQTTAGAADLSFRSRLCLTGTDRQKFLNGQVTNNLKDLPPGRGCYAALITARGKMQSDLNIYILENEILLDFEPGLSLAIAQRLEKYVIAEDVQIVDVAPLYGLLTLQGPKAAEALQRLGLDLTIPAEPFQFSTSRTDSLGEIYIMNQPRTGRAGFDLFVPTASLAAVADKLVAAARETGGGPVGWEALEMARLEAGIPRFGVDIDETNLPPEAGLDDRAISYNKGCYIGQEIIARIRTYGQVAKSLRGLRLESIGGTLPQKGEKLFLDGKDAGYVTSAAVSPSLGFPIALGYVRRQANQVGARLQIGTPAGPGSATIVELPFRH